jgi:hypothetical protein
LELPSVADRREEREFFSPPPVGVDRHRGPEGRDH